MPLHLYAVVLAEHAAPQGIGVQGATVDLVRSGDLAAAVSAVEPAVEATEDDAVAHLDVVTALLAGGPVIPMRFGTIAPDAAAVRQEVLDASRTEFARHLRATSDVVELLVTLRFDEDAALREALARDRWLGGVARGAGGTAERIAVGEEVAERLVTAVDAWSDELIGPISERAEDIARLDTPQHAMVRYALLVRRDRLSDVDEQVRRLPPSVTRGGVPYDVEYVGPLPPLDFSAPNEDSSPWGW